MLFLLSELRGVPVCARGEKKSCGRLKDLLFDPESGKLVAGFFSGGSAHNRVAAARDIVRLDKQAVIVKDREAIVPLAEIARARELQATGVKFLANKVWTVEGDFLGGVTDLEISSPDYALSSIQVVKKLFTLFKIGRSFLIPRAEIVRVTKKAIIVKNPLMPKPVEVDPAKAEGAEQLMGVAI